MIHLPLSLPPRQTVCCKAFVKMGVDFMKTLLRISFVNFWVTSNFHFKIGCDGLRYIDVSWNGFTGTIDSYLICHSAQCFSTGLSTNYRITGLSVNDNIDITVFAQTCNTSTAQASISYTVPVEVPIDSSNAVITAIVTGNSLCDFSVSVEATGFADVNDVFTTYTLCVGRVYNSATR